MRKPYERPGIDPILFRHEVTGLPPWLAKMRADGHDQTPYAKYLLSSWERDIRLARDYTSLANYEGAATVPIVQHLMGMYQLAKGSVYKALNRVAEQLHREHPDD